MNWNLPRDKEKCGIAIYNFSCDVPESIKLNVGSSVHILAEYGGWYMGYDFCNSAHRGIFPKSYIAIRECIVDKTGIHENVYPKRPPLIQEVTAVLREWGILFRHLYVTHDQNLEKIRDAIYYLINLRSKVLSGQIPGDELRQLKQCISQKIDVINMTLKLDLVVRDIQGNILNPDITSAVCLFQHHDEASGHLRKLMVPESTEISLCLYSWDPKENCEKPLTEAFVFPWDQEGYMKQQELLIDFKCYFTDLSTKILDEEQIFLIGTIIREGLMNSRLSCDVRKSSGFISKKSNSEPVRRPFGVIGVEITAALKSQKESTRISNPLNALYDELFAPLILCEKDTLEMVIKKHMCSRSDTMKENKNVVQGVWIDVSLFNGDIEQIQKENPHFSSVSDSNVSYCLNLSDVILPGDVRNDLYITLISGEFSKGGAIASDPNVEVTVRVYDENCTQISDVVYQGNGKKPLSEYRSVTYYHESRPKWYEHIKIALLIEQFRQAHLRFYFKHRSASDFKDKQERPFAMSFVKLIQENGTTLINTEHELCVYKIEHKKWVENDSSYLRLPWQRSSCDDVKLKGKTGVAGLSLSSSCSFIIATKFSSTKLTQNSQLLQLLELGYSMSSDCEKLKECIDGLKKVPPEELVIFLQDTMDVLFKVLMNSAANDQCSNMVFEAIVFVISIATGKNKHEAFQPILDSYIDQNFSSPLAYNQLIHILKYYVENRNTCDIETLKKAMKGLQYIFKFIIRSRMLFNQLNKQGHTEFQKSLELLLESLVSLMKDTNQNILTVQAQCLKYIPPAIPDIITCYDPLSFSNILVLMFNSLVPRRIVTQKLMTMDDIVHSELFKIQRCREVLLPTFVEHIRHHLIGNDEVSGFDTFEVVMRKERSNVKAAKILGESNATKTTEDKNKSDELSLAVKILGDTMDVLFSQSSIYSGLPDVYIVTRDLFRVILVLVARMEKDPLLGKFVTIFISILRQMDENLFIKLVDEIEVNMIPDFFIELLVVLKDLVEKPVFPDDWAELILLQSRVFVKILGYCSKLINERMREPFKEDNALQLEKFSQTKRNKIINRYKDMRREAGDNIRYLWLSLDNEKLRFITKSFEMSLVGPFLEMTMLPEVDLRKSTIPVFFDMMKCAYYSSFESTNNGRSKSKGKFYEFEREMLEKLDYFVELGLGDDHYKYIFSQIMISLCEKDPSFRSEGIRLVEIIEKLLERLLQYRMIMNDPEHSLETRMNCTVNLLDFYLKINQKELYLRYIYKLADLHTSCDNYTEAGYTLRLHADLLKWKHDIVSPSLRAPNSDWPIYHDELKEKLVYEIICLFDKGNMWEAAIDLCKNLAARYESVTMEYKKLAAILVKMADFYEKIMNPELVRAEPEYFRVAYYGRGFPAFLQNKVFVYRGNGFERLSSFQSRILDQFPNAELMSKLTPPGDDIKKSAVQRIQINKVECIPRPSPLVSLDVADPIRRYYRSNHVNTFSYSRPFHREPKNKTNEFATLCVEKTLLESRYELPGILRCFPAEVKESVELSPLENAIETMENANKEMEELVRSYCTNSSIMPPLEPLERKLSGMVDPAVMGGITNYEKAFLSGQYSKDDPKIERLQYLIKCQVPLLEVALTIHSNRVSGKMIDLHDHLRSSFQKMKQHIQNSYGATPTSSDLGLDIISHQKWNIRNPKNSGSLRSSHVFIGEESCGNFSMRTSISPHRSTKFSTIGPSGSGLGNNKSIIRNLLRRESIISKEPTTQWFDRHTEPLSPVSSSLDNHFSWTSRSSSARLLTQNAILNSTSSLSQDSNEYKRRSNPMSNSPPPLPSKNRLLLDQKSGVTHSSSVSLASLEWDRMNFNTDGELIPPEKPPRPNINQVSKNVT